MGIKDFFRRPGPEGGSQPEHHDMSLPFPEDLPDDLKVVIGGQEVTGRKAPDIWSNLHEDSEVSIHLPDGSTKKFKYGDIVKWNNTKTEDKENIMSGEGMDPGAQAKGDVKKPVDTINSTGEKPADSNFIPKYIEGTGFVYGMPESDTEPETTTVAETTKPSVSESKPATDSSDHDRQSDASSWSYQAANREGWESRDQGTGEADKKTDYVPDFIRGDEVAKVHDQQPEAASWNYREAKQGSWDSENKAANRQTEAGSWNYQTGKNAEWENRDQGPLSEPAELSEIRRVYTEMLTRNENMLGINRPKSDQEVTIENNYHKLLQEFILAWAENEVKRIQPKLEGSEREARIIELAAQKQAKESREIAGVGVDLYKESRYKMATNWLRKHPKLRFAVGAALTVGTVTTAALGMWPATAAFSTAKGALAGAGTVTGVEGGWDWLQNRREAKKGTTAAYTNEEIQAMSQEEAMRYVSGNLARSLEKGTSFDDDPQRKATIEALEAKRAEGLITKYQELLQQGLKPEQIIAIVMSEELKQEHLNHMAETKRRGNEAAAKRATALVSGATVGIITGLLPFHHPAAALAAKPGLETGQTAEGFKDYIVTKPGSVSLRSFAIRTARQISQKTGAHYSPNQQKTLAEGLYDMWQGPGNGVRGAGALLNKTSVRLPVDESMIRAAFRFPRTKF